MMQEIIEERDVEIKKVVHHRFIRSVLLWLFVFSICII